MNNVVNLIGRLGDKPNCRTLSDGARVAILSIATDDGYKSADGKWIDRTTWHRVSVFGDKRVDYIEAHYGKGDLVHFRGRLCYSHWEKDGVTQYGTELTGTTTTLAAAKREAVAEEQSISHRTMGERSQYPSDEDIPL